MQLGGGALPDHDLIERARELLRRDNAWRRILQIGFIIGGGVLVAVSEVGSSSSEPVIQTVFRTLWIVGAILVAVGALVFAFVDVGAAEAIRAGLAAEAAAVERANELSERLDAVEGELEESDELLYRQARLLAVTTALREIAEEVLLTGPGDSEVETNRFTRVLEILVNQKYVLFGMKDERWNFALYLFDGALGTLVCASCVRPTRAESDAPHRNIAPGTGHVGKVFTSKREAAADDATKPEYRELFEMTHEQGGKMDDANVYRSIASVPVQLGSNDPVGVLVATSDRPGRFWPKGSSNHDGYFDTVEPLRACAGALAIVIGASNLHRSKGRES